MSSVMEEFNESELLYIIPPEKHSKEDIISLIGAHPEIKFVSFVGVDLRGNDTDEKIPVKNFIEDIDEFLNGGVQTDGSSVVLPGIATLNDGKVDLVADISVKWFVDYNYEHIDFETKKPVGTLRIPSFLVHNGRRVDSRSILQKSVDYFSSEILKILKSNPKTAEELGINIDDIQEIRLTSATELEFWVKTPGDRAEYEELSASQMLQEQYWKRTKGTVRTALEKSLLLMERYGLEPEMGHKEVGGVKAQIGGEGRLNHIMEQLEIDWKYALALQAADNELIARILIKETFRRHGLEVTFMAKPIEGVAGSGEHTHVNVTAKLKNGKMVNLFAPRDMRKDFLNTVGWGALMGLLKNYEAVNPFIASSNDALNRLKPGFEAPICIVASIGKNAETPSRNRTVLVGLVKDNSNPMSLRFEVRSPNPHTNTYLALAAIYQAMLDGIRYAVSSGKTSKELEKEFTKEPGEHSDYLETDRAYRSEEDVFEHYTEEERNRLFGVPPATVWENLCNLQKYADKAAVLEQGGVFEKDILESYVKAARIQWTMELCERIINENAELVRSCVKLHKGREFNDYDEEIWTRINNLRHYLMKSSLREDSLFAEIRKNMDAGNYDEVSRLQLEMAEKIRELKKLYTEYKRNILDIEP
ncbi:glutamine synthetase [Pseudoclostridium thermosuccinogenes]|uniref:glutamine synthetase n=1 Tax=Clostridium thermosuccinogenes TaxID=84032 RepID=UPI002FD98E40